MVGEAGVPEDGITRLGGGATRGFLFSDLRDYTAFLDKHGADAAAALLTRYRTLVRAAVARYEGAEIRTEGDSFYVVFNSVSSALLCGLAIVDAAGAASSSPAEAIRVGVGVHAGETLETEEGYVGQPVNIAARLCAMAAPGEVLVSETVKTLTQTVLLRSFVPRGRRRLKGIGEPVQVYAAHSGAMGSMRAVDSSRRWTGRWGLVALVSVVAIAALAVVLLRQAPAGVPSRTWKIGLSLPLTGEVAEGAAPLERAVELAVNEVNGAALLRGSRIAISARDDGGGPFGEDPERGAANAAAFAADPDVVAVIGPWSSFVARAQIPITNEAGLLQCSPSNTDPGLTKPRAGALDLRAANPTRINFVRLPASADIEAAAGASFAYHDLGSARALVVDDAGDIGRLVADAFEREFEALGGMAVRRGLNPGADPLDVLQPLASNAEPPGLVFFGGFESGRAADVRRAMVATGHGDVPFLGWDVLWNGSGAMDESFIQLAGPAANGSFVSHPTVGTVRADFDRRYREAYGSVPEALTYEFAAAAHACAQIVSHSLGEVLDAPSASGGIREALRAYATDPTHRFDTVVGGISFDQNGDSRLQMVTFYRVDPAAAGGAGDWGQIKQQDFGPAP